MELIAKDKEGTSKKMYSLSRKRPKKELIRIVKNKEGQIFLDLTGKANGRGAYICKMLSVLKKL